VKAAAEMQKRLPTQKIFREMAFLDPAVLLSSSVRIEDGGLADLSELVAKFGVCFFFSVTMDACFLPAII